MNKTELIEKVALKANITKKDATAAVDAVFGTIQEALTEGDAVRLIGFGTFETRERKARTGRNPQDPENPIQIPASKAAVFKAGKGLKDAVNR